MLRKSQTILGSCASYPAVRRSALGIALAGAGLLGLSFASPVRSAESVFSYDLSRFRAIDPGLIGYRERAPIPLPGGTYTALATGEDGEIAAVGDKDLVLLSPERSIRVQAPLSAPGTCAALGKDGTVYVGHGGHIGVYGKDGAPIEDWVELGEQSILTSVAVVGDRVIVADAGQHRIFVFDLSGRLVRQWDGSEGGDPTGFVIPSPYFDVAAGPKDTVWVVNPGRLQLLHYRLDGTVGAIWGQSGMALAQFCGCCNPVHIAGLSNGSVATAEKGIARLKIYRANGIVETVVAGPEQFTGDMAGDDLAVDRRTGHILVLDGASSRIRVFESATEERQ